MTCTDYDRIADALHEALSHDSDGTVEGLAVGLAATFDHDPAFEYEAWLNHVMKGPRRTG